MRKKLSLSLAPLLAMAVLAATQATAQANTRFTATGTLTLSTQVVGQVECHVTFSGSVEGSKPIGIVQSFSATKCVARTCETLGGKGVKLSPEQLPWNAEVIQPEGGDGRFKLGFKGTSKEPGVMELAFNCKGVFNALFFGETAPKILQDGAELEFDSGSGELTSSEIGPGRLSGKFKVEGLKVTPSPGYRIEK